MLRPPLRRRKLENFLPCSEEPFVNFFKLDGSKHSGVCRTWGLVIFFRLCPRSRTLGPCQGTTCNAWAGTALLSWARSLVSLLNTTLSTCWICTWMGECFTFCSVFICVAKDIVLFIVVAHTSVEGQRLLSSLCRSDCPLVTWEQTEYLPIVPSKPSSPRPSLFGWTPYGFLQARKPSLVAQALNVIRPYRRSAVDPTIFVRAYTLRALKSLVVRECDWPTPVGGYEIGSESLDMVLESLLMIWRLHMSMYQNGKKRTRAAGISHRSTWTTPPGAHGRS